MERSRESLALCLLCGSTRQSSVVAVKERLLGAGETFLVVRCEGCGLLRTDPRPTKGEIGRYYPEHYGPHQPVEAADPWLGPGLKGTIRRWTLTAHYGYRLADCGGLQGWLISLLTWPLKSRYAGFPPFRPGGRLLEVGCGTGGRLSLLRSLGWDVQGVEVSGRACRAARARSGLEVFRGELEEACLPDASVDAVVMSHLIEHVHDPIGTLREVRRILRPGGVVLMETPNASSLERRVFGRYWFGWEIPRHLFLFDARTLGLCCARVGLRVRRVVHSSNTSGWIRSLAYWLEDRGSAGLAARRLRLLRREVAWDRLLKPLGIALALARVSGRLVVVAEAAHG